MPGDSSPKRAPRGKRRIEFLERAGYRQRRFRDAARMIPVFGAVLMVLPLMWPRTTPDQSPTSSGVLYIFGLWMILIVLSFFLSRVLNFTDMDDGDLLGQDRSGRTGINQDEIKRDGSQSRRAGE